MVREVVWTQKELVKVCTHWVELVMEEPTVKEGVGWIRVETD